MSERTPHTPYHPKWYRHPVSVWWWLESWPYTRFVLRELTSLPVAYFAVVLLWQLRSLSGGPESYARFLECMRSPVLIVISTLALAGVLFHALTWFHLAPKAIVVRLGGRRIPDVLIVLGNYLGWILLSAIVFWFWRG